LGAEDLPGVLRRCRRCVADGGGGPEAEMIVHHRQGQGALLAGRFLPSILYSKEYFPMIFFFCTVLD
jgi:hypothetical protein